MLGVPLWEFFCDRCKAVAQLSQREVDDTYRDGGFDDLLRNRLVGSMGRGGQSLGAEDDGPRLQLAPGQKPSPTGTIKQRPTVRRLRPLAVERPADDSPKPLPRLTRRPISRRTRRLLNVRRQLNQAIQQDPDDSA